MKRTTECKYCQAEIVSYLQGKGRPRSVCHDCAREKQYGYHNEWVRREGNRAKRVKWTRRYEAGRKQRAVERAAELRGARK